MKSWQERFDDLVTRKEQEAEAATLPPYVTEAEHRDPRLITPLVMDKPADLPQAFEQLREMDITHVSAIGGRRIAAQLVDARLVQDVYLTTSPRAGGEPNTPMYPGSLKRRRGR